jgi:hypothetical protein
MFRFIRRLIFLLIVLIVGLVVGGYYLVNHARQKVEHAIEEKVPKIANIDAMAKFDSVSLDATNFLRINFRVGLAGSDGSMKEVPGFSHAAWTLKPYDEVAFVTPLGNIK